MQKNILAVACMLAGSITAAQAQTKVTIDYNPNIPVQVNPGFQYGGGFNQGVDRVEIVLDDSALSSLADGAPSNLSLDSNSIQNGVLSAAAYDLSGTPHDVSNYAVLATISGNQEIRIGLMDYDGNNFRRDYVQLIYSAGSFTASGGTSDISGLNLDAFKSIDLVSGGGTTNPKSSYTNNVNGTVTFTPEPSSSILMGLGGLGLILRRRRA